MRMGGHHIASSLRDPSPTRHVCMATVAITNVDCCAVGHRSGSGWYSCELSVTTAFSDPQALLSVTPQLLGSERSIGQQAMQERVVLSCICTF